MDAEILKTLQNIEKLLKSTTSLSANKQLPTSKERDSKQKEQRSDQREFKAAAASAKSLKDNLYGLITSVSGLKSEVSKVTSSFGAFGSQLAKFIGNLEANPSTATVDPTSLSNLDKSILKLIETNLSIEKTLSTSTSLLEKIAQSSNEKVNAQVEKPNEGFLEKVLNTFFAKKPKEDSSKKLDANVQPGASKESDKIMKSSRDVSEQNKNLAETTRGVNKNLSFTGQMFETLFSQFDKLKEFVKVVGTDFLRLSAVGFGSSESLMTLYKNAFMSGLSLQEYAAILKDSTAALSRSSSLEDFNKTISSADKQLASLGVFGGEARAMQASLANSNTMMGVSQEKLSDAIKDQVKQFAILRKTTNMSAGEFASLVKSVSDSDQAQRELVGLQPAERQARQKQLIDIASLGSKMGLASEQSQKLAAAMLAARGETAASRWESAGRLRQMGAIVGMGMEAQRIAQLTLKGAARTAEEEKEYQAGLAKFDKRIQRERLAAQQTGNLGLEYQLDELEKTIKGTGAGQIMDSSRAATLAQESGRAGSNKDFGQNVSEFGKAVGEFAKYVTGFAQSPLSTLGAAITGAITFAFKDKIVNLLGSIFRGGPGGGAVSGVAKVAADAATQAKGLFYSFGYQLGKMTAAIPSLASKIFSGIVGAADTARKTLNALNLSAAITSPIEVVKNLFAGLGSKILNFVSTPIKAITSLMGSAKQAASGFKLTSLITGPIEVLKSVFSGAASKIASFIPSLKGAAGSIANIAQSIPGLSKIGAVMPFLKRIPLIGGLFTAAWEIFTGDVTAALTPSGGFFNSVAGVLTAVLSAIPNMVIDVLAFVFGDNLIQPIRNGFDTFVAFMNFAVKDFLARAIGGVAEVLKFILPKDSKLVKFLESTQNSLVDSATENAATVEKLTGDKEKTLKSISKDNKAAAAKANEEGKKAVTEANATAKEFNNVMYGLPTAQTLLKDAKALVGTTSAEPAKVVQATPEVQKPAPVVSEPVNKPQSQNEVTKTTEDQTSQALLGSNDVVGILQSMLAVLQQNLMTDQEQLRLTGQMLGQNRVKADFGSPSLMADRILGPRSI